MVTCTIIVAIGLATTFRSLDLPAADLRSAEVLAALIAGGLHAEMVDRSPVLARRPRSASILCQGGHLVSWGPDGAGAFAAVGTD